MAQRKFSKFIFIVGASRSGKSRYAQSLAKKIGGKVAFIATCVPRDKEMEKRVMMHKKSRPRHWKVFEEPKNPRVLLNGLKNKFDAIIIDCLGLIVSNFLAAGMDESKIRKEIAALAGCLAKTAATTILVSNEVGAGLVAQNPLGRQFVDLVGLANQAMAKKADTVILMHAGIPTKIKGE